MLMLFGLPFDYILTLVPLVSLIGIVLHVTFWLISWIVCSVWGQRRDSTVSSTTTSSTTCPSSSKTTALGPTLLTILLLGLALDAPLLHNTRPPSRNQQRSNGRPLGDGLYDFIQGRDPLLNELLEQTPDLLQGPSPPLLFQNRHLQFIPWLIQNEIHRQQGIPFQREYVEVTSCRWQTALSDDEGCIPDPRLNDTITLDIFPPFDDAVTTGFNKSSPIIVFIPGLRCYSQDMPGNMIIRRAYAEGFRSIVVNRRGHTPGQILRAPRWNLFGDTHDLEQVYWYIKDTLVGNDTSSSVAMFLHGISSGTAVGVSSLGLWDEQLQQRQRQEKEERQLLLQYHRSGNFTSTTKRRRKRIPTFVASISMTPGYDTSRVMQTDRFRFPYNHLFVPLVQDHFVKQNEDILRLHDSNAVDRILATKTLQEFVDASVVFAGYPSKQEYYEYTNPINNLTALTTPKLVINSWDDPCCLVDNIYERSPYSWHSNMSYAEMANASQRSMIVVTKTGTHCPFLDAGRTFSLFPKMMKDPLFGGYMLDSWADRVAIQFYKAALNVYGDRRFL